MTQEQKHIVKAALDIYCQKMGSQNAAANKLVGISSATITQVLKDNWESISDEMWRKIAAGIKLQTQTWAIAETSVYKKSHIYFNDAQRNPQGITSIIVNASMGKSVAVESWSNSHKNSYYILCHRHINIRGLLRDMLKTMGKDCSGTTGEMLENLVSYLARENQPLFIIDEVDKLKDEVLEMFIDIENKLHNKCGLVFLSTPYLKKRMEAGVARNKRGFAELYSRMRKIFWDLTPDRGEFKQDVAAICKANGIDDKAIIVEFGNSCDYDFRVLTDLINAHKNKLENNS